MMKTGKKLLAIVLTVSLVLSGMCVGVYAETEEPTAAEIVAAQLENIDSLQEMQTNRKNYDKEGYEAYIADMFTQRQAAQAAYDALSADEQATLDPALVEKLDDQLDNVITPKVTEVTKKDGYQFQAIFPRNQAYEMGTSYNDGGHPMTVMVVDTEQITGSWSPSDLYAFGVSDYEVLYCCEMKQPVINGTHYNRVNLEDADYYGEEEAAHIRAIVTNSYPYVSLDQMKADLAAAGYPYADELTRGDIISAVQFAIWHFSNAEYAFVEGMDRYGLTLDINNVSYASAYHNYANEMWNWWQVGRNGSFYDADAEERVNALVDYLIGLEEVYADENVMAISAAEIVGAEPVQFTEDLYNVVVKVKLSHSGVSEADDVKLTVAGTADPVVIDVETGVTEYDVMVQAHGNDIITIDVDGEQNLPKDVYLYEPDGGKEVSQVLVGVADGKTVIDLHDEISFPVEEEPPVTADLVLQKTDVYGEPLTGAEFALSLEKDGLSYAIGTYAVDENGQLVVEDLLPGTYALTETKTPEGFIAPEAPMVFTIDEDGNITEDEELAELVNGVLTIVNKPELPPDEYIEEEEDPKDEDPKKELPPDEYVIEETEKSPETGDAGATAWMLLGFIAVAGIYGLCEMKRKEN